MEGANRCFFELRRYPLKPGKADEWVKLMDEVIIPFQLSKGHGCVGILCQRS